MKVNFVKVKDTENDWECVEASCFGAVKVHLEHNRHYWKMYIFGEEYRTFDLFVDVKIYTEKVINRANHSIGFPEGDTSESICQRVFQMLIRLGVHRLRDTLN